MRFKVLVTASVATASFVYWAALFGQEDCCKKSDPKAQDTRRGTGDEDCCKKSDPPKAQDTRLGTADEESLNAAKPATQMVGPPEDCCKNNDPARHGVLEAARHNAATPASTAVRALSGSAAR
jgi:hypothetical protein